MTAAEAEEEILGVSFWPSAPKKIEWFNGTTPRVGAEAAAEPWIAVQRIEFVRKLPPAQSKKGEQAKQDQSAGEQAVDVPKEEGNSMADGGHAGASNDVTCRIHNKSECTNARVFTGTCRVCSKEGHSARDCPDKPPVVCRNCKEEGHLTSECKANKKFDMSDVAVLPIEEAWVDLVKTANDAARTRDLDDFRTALKVYVKAVGDVTYHELERSFRANDIGIYIIGIEPTEGELLDTNTLVDLQGKRDCKYKVGLFFKKSPRTSKMAAFWPKDDEDNLERLKDAGVPYERGVPKCLRCKGKSARVLTERAPKLTQSLFFQRWVIPPEIAPKKPSRSKRPPSNVSIVRRKVIVPVIALLLVLIALLVATANNLDTSLANALSLAPLKELSANAAMKLVTLPRIVPTLVEMHAVTAGKIQLCTSLMAPCLSNVSEEGHMAKECEKPRNPANAKCRNCDEVGHFSKDCPQPKDWSKVKCNTCDQMGHTSKRCPQANADSGAGAANTDYDAGTGGGESTAVSGGWDADAGGASVKGDWDTGAAASNSFAAESSAPAAGW
ncbi:MAG: hypothetical protein Q9174_005779 [Haloplaca sp. 1 TL-2023]